MAYAETVHDAAAEILRYPADLGLDALLAHVATLDAAVPEAHEALAPLAALAREGKVEPLEELYTTAFDNVAERALEVGWQVYGENYSRGAFLVRMRELLRELGLKEGTELPDHLVHVLPVLARVRRDFAELIAADVALPAVTKASAAFGSDPNPYAGAVRVAATIVASHVPEPETFHV